MPVRNTQCKYKYQERVKIAKGFYRDHTGLVQSVIYLNSWFKKQTMYEVHCTNVYTSVQVMEEDLVSMDFNDKLQKVLEDDSNKDRS